MNSALNHILQSEADAALDATWESGSFAGHRVVDVEEHWFAVNWMLEVAREKGNTESIEHLTKRLEQIDTFLKLTSTPSAK